MTFDQIRAEVLERMSLSSTDASTRVGAAINRHYKRITSLLGMETTRYVSKDVVMTLGVRTVTVPGVEKVDRVADITSQLRLLTEVSLHQMRTLEPTAVEPQVWALSNTQAQAVVLMFDTFPDFAWTLRVDGWTTLTDLTGAGEPAFPASFHDILTWFVLAEELLRKEKSQLAAAYEQKAAGLLDDLRFHLADTHTRTLVQHSQPGGGAAGGSGQGGGGGAPGGAAYLTNIPESTIVGRGQGQGTGVSQHLAVAGKLELSGLMLQTKSNVVDTFAPGVVNQIAYFTDPARIAGHPAFVLDTGFGGVQLFTNSVNGPYIDFRQAAQPANNRLFRVITSGPDLEIQALADDFTLQISPLFLGRGGDVTVGRWLFLAGGSAHFPATAIPSSSPYALDDYREGTWSPVIGGATGTSGQTYATQAGLYIKVGAMVTVWGWVVLSVKGTISGAVQLQGLPFPIGAAFPYGANPVNWIDLATTWVNIRALALPGASALELRGAQAAATTSNSAVAETDITANTAFTFSASYRTAD